MTEQSTAYLFLHTHWDREWYLPFEVYRARLVSVVRTVIKGLNSGELPNFLLDGQASVLEDVLEIDPSLYLPIQDLMEQNILSAGPWYVLADQMLVRGESLIRNLQQGLETTSMYGAPAMIGYCPDTFGHSADLPRILKGFNIDTAYVWRGVPKLDSGPLFLWQSNDGSSVLSFQLSRGYYDPTFHNATGDTDLLGHIGKWLPPNDSHYCRQINAALIPVGADHLAPPRDMDKLLARLKAAIDEKTPTKTKDKKGSKDLAVAERALQVVPTSLSDFSKKLRESVNLDALPVVEGELRDNSAALIFERAYVLQGVLSSRLYLKRENHIAEHRLVNLSEPLHAIFYVLKISDYPALELKHAWKLLMRNHPHDSICGCSIDSVHREMQSRTVKFHELLNGLDAEAARAIASPTTGSGLLTAARSLPVVDPALAPDRITFFNTSGEALISPVPFIWATEDEADGEPLLEDPERFDMQIVASEKSVEIFSGSGNEPIVKTVNLHHGWLWSDKIPAFGGKTVNWIQNAFSKPARQLPKKVENIKRAREFVSTDARRVSNEFLSVEIEPDGTVIVISHETRRRSRMYRLGHTLRDVADCGDSYNFDPLPGDKPLTAKFIGVRSGLHGPLVGSLLIDYEMKIPLDAEEVTRSAMTDGFPDGPSAFIRSNKTVVHKFRTEISLRRGVPIVFFDTEWENKSSDHRLEVLMDTELDVQMSFAENHFSVVKRERPNFKTALPVAKGTEAPLDRLPCQRFFAANDQVFFNAGLPEYGMDGSNVSITLLRAFSHLSRSRLQTRGGGAGPGVPTPEGNCLGLNRASYGWSPLAPARGGIFTDSLPEAQLIRVYNLVELFEGRFRAVLSHSSWNDKIASLLSIENPAMRLVSSYIFDHKLYLRLLNVTDSVQDVRINLRLPTDAAFICKLNQEPTEELPIERGEGNASSRVTLLPGKNELMTVRLDLE
jgi:mannosylglycerate hydrolase